MAFCTACGAEYEVGRPRCDRCGSPLPEIPAHRPLTASPADPLHSSSTSRARRVVAGAIDAAICIALVAYMFRVLGQRILLRPTKGSVAALLAAVLIPALYVVARDSFRGKSVGKMLLALTAVDASTLKPIGLRESILRNVLFAFIAVPVVGWSIFAILAAVSAVQILRGAPQRIGDGLAGTTVVEDSALGLQGPREERCTAQRVALPE